MPRFELTDAFYEDEIREGFYIPSAVKKAWGAELQVLNEVDRVCAQLGIRYFATWGTFLGAVRHGGYVPWDDDLDICMLRDDYNRFLEEGVPLLPEGYEVYNHNTRADHVKFVANIVAKSRNCFEEEHLKAYHGFPYIVGIDVFQLDYMSPDPKKHELFRLKSMLLLKVSGDIVQGRLEETELRRQLKELEETVGIRVPDGMDREEIRQFLDRKVVELFSYALDEKEKAERIVQMMPCGIWNDDFYIYPAKFYAKQAEIPFEMGKMPVALYYEPAAAKHYRDYMVTFRGGGAHLYPYFAKMQEELRELSGGELPEYHVNPGELTGRRVAPENTGSADEGAETYKAVVSECLEEMEKRIGELKDASEAELLSGLCGELQQLAIDLGTYMEAVKGEGYDIVTDLERLCEALYALSQEDTGENRTAAAKEYELVSRKIRARKEVVFLPFKEAYWEAFAAEYRKWTEDPDADVVVIPIPYYYKDHLGQLYDMQYDLSEYPQELPIRHYEEYDYTLRHPDVIFIQNPYDQWNEITSVPPFFFSDRLLGFTDRLIYIPWFRTYDFTKEDQKAYFNMKYYCDMPGVVHADQVILPSEMLRETYIERLCEFAGEESREIWEKKLVVAAGAGGREKADASVPTRKLLYYQDFSDMLLYSQQAVGQLKSAIRRFKEDTRYEKMILLKGTLVEELLPEEAPELYKEYREALQEAAAETDIEVVAESDVKIEQLVAECDAFRGDAGRIAHGFDAAGKPFEIQEYPAWEKDGIAGTTG